MTRVEQCIARVQNMGLEELAVYRVKVSMSNCTKEERNALYDVLDARMAKLRRDDLWVENTEVHEGEFFQ